MAFPSKTWADGAARSSIQTPSSLQVIDLRR